MVDLRVFQYRLRTKPFPVGRADVTNRDGLLLRCKRENGRVDWAEAAPLPGWSKETVHDVIAAIREGDFERFPSLDFAYSTLMQNEAADEKITAPLNALLTGTGDEVLSQAASLAASPLTAVKLKVGRGDVVDDVALVKALRNALRSDQSLRLDANRAWSLDDGVQFGRACRGIDIEYIEEPVDDPNECEMFFDQTGLPYAFDETVIEERIPNCPHLAALVVKPTLVGGMRKLTSLRRFGVPLVFSSAFESHVGLGVIARLGNQISPGTPMGLDTHRWLLENLVGRSVAFGDGDVSVQGPFDVDESKLEEVSL